MGVIDAIKTFVSWKKKAVDVRRENGAPGVSTFRSLLGNGSEGETQDPTKQVNNNTQWVYVATSKISDTIAKTKLRILARVNGENTDISDTLPDHPLVKLWRKPNKQHSAYIIKKLLASSLLLTGDAYLWKIRNAIGVVTEIYVLQPQFVTPRYASGQLTYTYATGGGGQTILSGDDVVHILMPDLRSTLHGIAPVQAATDAVNTHRSIHRSQAEAFQQGINPSAIVSVDGTLDEKAQTRLRSSLDALYKGSSNHGKILIKDKRTDIEPWSMTPAEMNYIQSMEANRDEILGVFGVPKLLAGLAGDINKASAYVLERVFAKNTVLPLLILMADQLTMQLAAEFDERIVMEFESPEPRDQELLLQTTAQGIASGTITDNEWRQEYGWDSVDDGDVRYKPLNMMPVGMEPGEPDDDDKAAKGMMTKADDPVIPFDPGNPSTWISSAIDWDAEADEFGDAARPEIARTVSQGWGAEASLAGGERPATLMEQARTQYMLTKDRSYFDVLNESTRTDIANELADGIKNGEGFKQLRARIADVYAGGPVRSERIARTEVLDAQNFGGQAARDAYDVPEKEWVCRFLNSREDHMAADGQVVRNDRDFSVGSTSMSRPGDPGAPLDQVVNCQCTAVGHYGKSFADWHALAGEFATLAKNIQDRNSRRMAPRLVRYFNRERVKVLAAFDDLLKMGGGV